MKNSKILFLSLLACLFITFASFSDSKKSGDPITEKLTKDQLIETIANDNDYKKFIHDILDDLYNNLSSEKERHEAYDNYLNDNLFVDYSENLANLSYDEQIQVALAAGEIIYNAMPENAICTCKSRCHYCCVLTGISASAFYGCRIQYCPGGIKC